MIYITVTSDGAKEVSSLNAYSGASLVEIKVIENAHLWLTSIEGAGRRKVPGPATLTGSLIVVRGLTWIETAEYPGFGIAVARPSESDDLKSAWSEGDVEVYATHLGGKRQEYFDD